MTFKYKWKNGATPTPDEAAHKAHLLDEDQFETTQDQKIAEEQARQYLNVPLRTLDADKYPLPHGDSTNQSADMQKP